MKKIRSIKTKKHFIIIPTFIYNFARKMTSNLREKFTITGYFYNIQQYSFRKFLNIKRKTNPLQKPDIIVIMMNPGASKQQKGFSYEFNTEVPTIPDKTQDQIMKVMNNTNLNYARILNLSDIREPKSKIFIEKIKILNEKKIPHSIFCQQRKKDFTKLFIPKIPVICAWGVNPKLTPIAKTAFNKIKNEKIIGIKKNSNYSFYHPLPQNNTLQKKWVQTISNLLKQ